MRASIIEQALAELGGRPSRSRARRHPLRMGETYWYLDAFDDLIVIGLVHNDGDTPADGASVTITLYDEDGDIVAPSRVRRSRHPGRAPPLQGRLLGQPGQVRAAGGVVRARGSGGWWGEEPYDGIVLSRERVHEWDDEWDDQDEFSLVIEAVNDGDSPAGSVQAVVTAYDAEGGLAGVGYITSDRDYVAPGDTATFNVSFDVHAPVARHTVQFDARTTEEVETPDVEITSLTAFAASGATSLCRRVTNHSSEPATWIEILLTVNGEDGSLVAANSTGILMDIVPAGERTFCLSLGGDPTASRWRRASRPSSPRNGRWTTRTRSSRCFSTTAWIAATRSGRGWDRQNVGDTAAEWIEVILTAYGADGQVVGAGSSMIELDPLDPEDESPFEVTVSLAAPAKSTACRWKAVAS